VKQVPISLLALALCVILPFLVGCGKSPGHVAREYVDCTIRGDLAGMRALCAGEAAEKLAQPQAVFAASMSVSILEQMGGVSGCEVVEEMIVGDTATVVLRLLPKQPDSEAAKVFAEPRPVYLSRIDGAWKVTGD